MRDLFYIELRGRCEEIRRQEQTEATAEEYEMLAKTVLYLVGLLVKARKLLDHADMQKRVRLGQICTMSYV